MAYAGARELNADEIPVVDIEPLISGNDDAVVASQLHAASTGLGFIYVRGHGIDPKIIEDARQTALEFFRLPDCEKKAVTISDAHRGWLSRGGAKMDEKQSPDLKESFLWGGELPGNSPKHAHPLYGPNQWPEANIQFRDTAMAFYSQASRVAQCLLRGFALGLNLPSDFFVRTVDEPLSRASYVFYPQQPASLGVDQFGVGPHTDFGVLTVLCQDDVGGLQICDSNGEWIHAPPIADTLVVNVADLLSRWTGGQYKSTPHRVVNVSGKERLSLVLAYDPNPQTLVDPREVMGDRYQGNEPPITCGDYLLWRFARAFSYRNPPPR